MILPRRILTLSYTSGQQGSLTYLPRSGRSTERCRNIAGYHHRPRLPVQTLGSRPEVLRRATHFTNSFVYVFDTSTSAERTVSRETASAFAATSAASAFMMPS